MLSSRADDNGVDVEVSASLTDELERVLGELVGGVERTPPTGNGGGVDQLFRDAGSGHRRAGPRGDDGRSSRSRRHPCPRAFERVGNGAVQARQLERRNVARTASRTSACAKRRSSPDTGTSMRRHDRRVERVEAGVVVEPEASTSTGRSSRSPAMRPTGADGW